MTIENEINQRTHNVTDLGVDRYSYDFRLIDSSDAEVFVRQSPTSNEIQLEETVHYSVTDVGQNTGGNIIVTSGYKYVGKSTFLTFVKGFHHALTLLL